MKAKVKSVPLGTKSKYCWLSCFDELKQENVDKIIDVEVQGDFPHVYESGGSFYDKEWLEFIKESIMKITLANGATIEGTPEQVKEIAKVLGVKLEGFYNSSSRGVILIKDMATEHIRNALLLKMQMHFRKYSGKLTEKTEVMNFLTGPSEYDQEFRDLLEEYKKR